MKPNLRVTFTLEIERDHTTDNPMAPVVEDLLIQVAHSRLAGGNEEDKGVPVRFVGIADVPNTGKFFVPTYSLPATVTMNYEVLK